MTTPEQWRRIFALLDSALDLPREHHEHWLATLGDDDADLRPALRRLLDEHGSKASAHLLQSLPQFTPEETALEDPARPGAGDVIAMYRLKREIGRGGMARVWLAERIDGAFQRDVALKLPYFTWDDALAQRMQRERTILATLEHPNIARLYDAGLDQLGRPFMAMEYVEGEPIDVYVRSRTLSIRDRLLLILQIARALAHAHARLVVHRDLKPSNVLVTAEGSVRLLDFGVAKLLSDVVNPALTESAARALTRDYAAPEQITGGTITAATDVYALAVVAFELLTGTRPYQLTGQSLHEIELSIAQAEPVLASSVADRLLQRSLRGDLDAILEKALQKSADDRYPTAEAFAADIERYLDGEPVHARRSTRRYRLAKFVRKHRTAVVAASLIALTLLITTYIALEQARVAANERNKALSLAQRNEAVVQFVDQMLTEIASPDQPITIDTLLERSEFLVFNGSARNPEHQAAVLLMLARYYAVFDNNRKAGELIDSAFKLASNSSESGLRAKIECERMLIELPRDIANAEQHIRNLLEPTLPPDATATCLRVIARLYAVSGDARRMLPAVSEAQKILGAAPASDRLLGAMLIVDEGIAHRLNGQFGLADRAFAQALREYQRIGRPEHPTVIAAWSEWANTLNASGNFRGAVQKFEQAVAISRKHAMGGSPPTNVLFNYAHMLRQVERYDEALEIYDRELPRAKDSASTRAFINGMLGKARLYIDQDRLELAEQILDELKAPLSADTLRKSQEGIAADGIRGRIASARGDWTTAVDAFTKVLDGYATRRIRFGNVVISLCERGYAHLKLGDLARAEQDAQQADDLAQSLSATSTASALPGYSAALLSQLQFAQGKAAEADATAARALDVLSTTLGHHHPDTKRAQRSIDAARNASR